MTSSLLLDGKKIASELAKKSTSLVSNYQKITGKNPILATILVGEDPASETYVRMKHKACEKVGIKPLAKKLVAESSTEELLALIDSLNADPDVFGILLQHPISSHMDERLCFDAIAFEKDVDGVTSLGYGRMSMGSQAYGSCTPQGIMHLLAAYDLDLQGLNAVVVGRSPILGKPMSAMLLEANATVTTCHSRTKNLTSHLANADIVVAALGKREFIKSHWLPDDCIVIDAGFHPGGVGDVEINDDLIARSKAYTPVPGGVGPMTIATLIYQTALATQLALSQS